MIDVIQLLKDKEAKLKATNTQPASVMMTELLNDVNELAKEELRQAVLGGTLECHRTINDVSFNTKQ